MRARTTWWIFLTLLCSCGSSEPAAPASQPSSGAEVATGPTPTMDRKMWHHFWDVADARDAVIGGDPAGVHVPLERLAAGTFGVEDMPPDWLPWAEEMQQEAARGAGAKTIAEAANVVAAVAQRCGDCHRATRGGPAMEDDLQTFDAHGRTGLKGAMAQHVWASEELWLGMTVPHHQSWVAGAKALSETPLPQLKTEGVDAAMQAKLDAVRAMGERALAAGTPVEMARVYGELIAACGTCHAAQ
jgi:cytochrome c553